MDALPPDAIHARREHPIAFWSLVVAMLTPMVVGVTALGLLAKHLFPTPPQLVILAGAGLFILAIAPLMLLGAFGWLLMARAFVPRSVAKAFFIHPGFGILSRVSEWMFIGVYGRDDE
jgi:hypothetical protein